MFELKTEQCGSEQKEFAQVLERFVDYDSLPH